MYLRRLPCVGRMFIGTSAGRHFHGHPECQPRPRNPYLDHGFEESIWGPRPRTLIGGKHLVTMVNGVGYGRELMEVVRHVFLCANAPIAFEIIDMDENAAEDEMENLIYSVERNGVAIKGHLGHHQDPGELMRRSHKLKRALDLFVNIVEMKSYPAIASKTRLKARLDVVLICPNSEGASAVLEHDNSKGVEYLRVTTSYNTERVAEFAFKYAISHKRRKVTLVYNKGVMTTAEGTIVEAASKVAAKFPDVQFQNQSMKAFIFKMKDFAFNGDVIVTMPLAAGLIKNILLGMTHTSGMYCAQNLGPRYAVFEAAARNKGVKLMGKDLANPVAVLDAGVKLLEFLGHHECAGRIKNAVQETINTDGIHTRDILGDARLSMMVTNIERRLREDMPEGYS